MLDSSYAAPTQTTDQDFVYLATLYVMVDRMRLEASLAVAAATVRVSIWTRVHG
ncbi:hypothetical protein D3C78_1964770 [compost metagenome]